MSFTKAQEKRFKKLMAGKGEQGGEGFLDDVFSVVKKAAKAIGGVFKFALKGIRKISSFLEDAGVPLSDQAAFLAWMATQGEYAAAAKMLSAASSGLKQFGRGCCQSGKGPQGNVANQETPKNLTQLAEPNANEKFASDNTDIPQLADPTANDLSAEPSFGRSRMGMKGLGRAPARGKAPPRSWTAASQGNVEAVTSDARPKFA